MRPRTGVSNISVAIVLTVLLLVSPAVAAGPGGPVLDYLQDTIKPLLDTIQSSVNAIGSIVSQILTKTNSIQATVNAAPKLSVVHAKLTTAANSTTGLNLDVNAIPAVQGSKIRRYTVTLTFLNNPAIPGVDSARLVVGAFDGVNTFYDVNVASIDPATQFSIVTGPYAGSNSFVTIHRGADGAGNIDVVINAYIESEP